ncbi:MAG: 30S ribosomal protein S2 [Candidatus Doudnabacteria bacterium]|nr:30S ribosomal protein S2 [Candidatus Doudnabacteria bacterium]
MKDITLLELLKSGAHFGHTTSRWNPKMKPYIFTARNNIHILDLEKTKQALLKAAEFAKTIVSKGGIILFVGTKKQSKEILKNAAVSCGMPYVNVRWLGGTFTNFRTIQKTIRKLEKLESMKASGELESRYTKKERLMIEREIEKLKKLFEGIANMKRLPEAIFATDVKHEDIAVKEAQKSKVKIIGLVDTNCDPERLDFPIPCNDDSTKAVELVCNYMAEAINEGKTAIPVIKEEVKIEK